MFHKYLNKERADLLYSLNIRFFLIYQNRIKFILIQ